MKNATYLILQDINKFYALIEPKNYAARDHKIQNKEKESKSKLLYKRKQELLPNLSFNAWEKDVNSFKILLSWNSSYSNTITT